MDCLAVLWLLDNRWLFGLNPPLGHGLILLPATLNLAVLAVTSANRVGFGCQYSYNLVDMLVTLAILIVLEITLFAWLLVSQKQVSKQLSTLEENKENAIRFVTQFRAKKITWSWLSLTIVVFSLIMLGFNSTYVRGNRCVNTSIQILFYANIVVWIYIVLMFLAFLARKLSYLCVAWKFPKAYLKFKGIVR